MIDAADAAETPAAIGIATAIIRFARFLRAAGLPIGTGQAIDGVRSVEALGIGDREHVYWTLHAVFVKSPDQHSLFDQAFALFWHDRSKFHRSPGFLLTGVESLEMAKPVALRRLVEAIVSPKPLPPPLSGQTEDVIEAVMTWSASEVLQRKDFEQMSADEIEAAKAMVRRLRLPFSVVPQRRYRPDPGGTVADLRASLRAAARLGATCWNCGIAAVAGAASAGRAVRHLRVHRSLRAHASPFFARRDERARQGPRVSVRYSTDQRHTPPSSSGHRRRDGEGRRSGRRLVGGTRIGACLASSIARGANALYLQGRTCC